MTVTIFRIAWRNLWRHKRRTTLTAFAFALGVFLLIVSLGLGDGMHQKMIETAVRMGSGHVVVEPRGARDTVGDSLFILPDDARAISRAVRQDPVAALVRATAPRLLTSGLLSSATNSSGVQVVGIEVAREIGVALLPEKIVDGTFLAENGRTPPIVVGRDLAEKLDVRIGSKVVLMAQGRSELQSQLLRVRGIFSTGMSDVDGHLATVRLADLQMFLERPGAISHEAIFLDAAEDAARVRAVLASATGDRSLSVLTWREAMPELDQFILLDDIGNYLFNGVLLFMVTLGVLNTVLMAVLERRREFSLLVAMGMRPLHVALMVIVEGMMLTAVGAALGLGTGLGTHRYFATHGLNLARFMDESFTVAGVAVDTTVHSFLYPDRVPSVLVFIVLLGLMASVYPATRAARTQAREATLG